MILIITKATKAIYLFKQLNISQINLLIKYVEAKNKKMLTGSQVKKDSETVS